MRWFFARLDETRNLLESFETIFLRKSLNMHYFCIFFKKFNKPFVNFWHVWTKNANCWEIFDENSIEKLIFYFIFRKFVTKNRAFGNNTSFLQQFFGFGRGGDFPPSPPWLRPWGKGKSISQVHSKNSNRTNLLLYIKRN